MQTSQNHQSCGTGRWNRNTEGCCSVVNKHFWLEYAHEQAPPYKNTHIHSDKKVLICAMDSVLRLRVAHTPTATPTPFTRKPHRAVQTRWLHDSFCMVIPIIATTKTTPPPQYYRPSLAYSWLRPKTTTQYAYTYMVYLYLYENVIYLCLRKLDNDFIAKRQNTSHHNFTLTKILQPPNACSISTLMWYILSVALHVTTIWLFQLIFFLLFSRYERLQIDVVFYLCLSNAFAFCIRCSFILFTKQSLHITTMHILAWAVAMVSPIVQLPPSFIFWTKGRQVCCIYYAFCTFYSILFNSIHCDSSLMCIYIFILYVPVSFQNVSLTRYEMWLGEMRENCVSLRSSHEIFLVAFHFKHKKNA